MASFAGLMCHCTLCWWWWLVSLFSLVVVALASFVGVMLGFVKFGQGRLRQIKIKVKFQLGQVPSNFDMCLGDKAALAPLFVVVFFPFGCGGCCFGSRCRVDVSLGWRDG